MIEYFKLKNFMSNRDETELSFVASNKSGGKNEVPVSWYKIIDGKRILKLLLGIGLNGTGKTKMIRGLSYLRRLATLKPEKPTEKPDYRPFLLDEYSAKEPTEMWLSYYINEEKPGKSALHDLGLFYVQEPSAMSAVAFLDIDKGDKVLDLWSAPGGKGTQIAEKLNGSGIVLMNEKIPDRAKILSRNVERLGIGNAVVTNEDPEIIAKTFLEYFDKV